MQMGDPLLLDDDLFGLQELTHETPYSPYSLHTLLLSHHSSRVHANRHRRFVVTHSMIEQSRFNIALLILFILCIFLVNAFFIAIILWSKTLRSNSKHILILSVAFADLLQGLLILPLITDIGNRDSFDSDCTTFQVSRRWRCIEEKKKGRRRGERRRR